MQTALKYFTIVIIPFILLGSIYYFDNPSLIILGIVIYAVFDYRFPLFFLPLFFINHDPLFISIVSVCAGLAILLRRFYTKNKYYSYLFLGLLLAFSNSIYYIYYKNDLINILILLFFSLSIYFIMLKTINIYHLDDKSIAKVGKLIIFQSLFTLILGISSIGFNQYYFLLINTAMILFLSRINYQGFSLIYGVLCFGLAYITKIDFPFIYLIISLVYLIPYSYLIAFILLLLDYLVIKQLDIYQIGILAVAVIIYELLKLIPLEYFEKKTSILNMYDNIINNFNDQVLKFASFLDEFERKFITNRDQKIKFNESYNYLVNTYCLKCNKKSDCFMNKKNETYLFLKSALLFGHSIMVKRDNTLSLDFINSCLHHDEIINKSNILKNKYNLNKERTSHEQALESQLIGVSNTLRQYVVDISSKREMHLELFLDFKNSLVENGYKILLFNVRRIFKNDFWIEVGISNITVSEINSIVLLEAEKRLGNKVSIEIRKQSNNYIYFFIVPYISYNILYGHGSIAKDSLLIGGDNYLIKDLETGQFIAAISDGMGSGYKAYTESKETLELLDKITEFEINPNTSINMLNTFYQIKESMDQYATLDFLEINKTNGEAILFKMGSSHTYLVRDSEISVIYNQNLPFGINDLITKDELVLKDKDCIILASDGINDNITKDELENAVFLSLHKDPQAMAYDILNKIINKEKKALDDMSIIVLKVEKSAA